MKRTFHQLALLLLLIAPQAPAASVESRRAPNVAAQFANLQFHGEPFSWHRAGVADDVSSYTSPCKHYQGMARDPRLGPAYLYVTRSGNSTAFCNGASDDPGELVVVKLASRNSDGERLRSNLLRRSQSVSTHEPVPQDRAVAHIKFDGSDDVNGNAWPSFRHPGAPQFIGDRWLVVPMEVAHDGDWITNSGGLCLIDVSNPEQPTLAKWWSTGGKAGLVAVDRRRDGKYQFITTKNDSDDLSHYETSTTNLLTSSLLFLGSSLIDVTQPVLESGWEVWQSFQFIRQDDTNLFLLAMDSPNDLPSDGTPGVAALYRFSTTNNGGQTFHLELVQRRTFKMSEPLVGDFDAVGAAYVSPSGELILYAGEHRDGPESPGDTVRMGEWRSRDLYNVRAQDPCNPWVQLYAENNNDGSSLAVEFQDYFMDDYDNLNDMRIAPGDANGWSDRARSIRWYAPPGTTIRLRNFGSGTSGGAHIDLVGNGSVQSIPNLATRSWDNAVGSPNLAITGVEFIGTGSPVAYIPDFVADYEAALPFMNVLPITSCRTVSFMEGSHGVPARIGGTGNPHRLISRSGSAKLTRN